MNQSQHLQPPARICMKKHRASQMAFCKNCARDQRLADKSFFCKQCEPNWRAAHSFHQTDVQTLNLFVGPNHFYKKFKTAVIDYLNSKTIQALQNINKGITIAQCKQKLQAMIKQTPPDQFKNILNSNDDLISQELQNQNFRRWLIDAKFWENQINRNYIIQSIDKYLNKVLFKEERTQGWSTRFGMQSLSASAIDYLSNEVANIQKKIQFMKNQTKLSELLLNVTSYFTQEQVEKGLKQIDCVFGHYETVPFLFYLGKLKILQLHDDGQIKMKQILSQIDISKNSPRQKQLYYYFKAISEWKLVRNIENQNYQTKIFYQSRNQKNYKLQNPDSYIKWLTLAIQCSKQQKNEKPMYYASRAIGYLIKDDYQQANQQFKKAKQLKFQNDSADSNYNYCKINQNLKINQNEMTRDLSKRSIEYIINLCRYFKAKKQYNSLGYCCEELVHKQQDNLSFRLKNFDAKIKMDDIMGSKNQLGKIRELGGLTDHQITELDRKIQFLTAKENYGYDIYQNAEEKFEHVAKVGEPSATHWYNLAAFLFQKREQSQKNSKALQAINRAIEIKPKKNFFQLKYLILFVMGNYEQAREIQKKYIGSEDTKFGPLVEFINNE